jgi:hypothetical protein
LWHSRLGHLGESQLDGLLATPVGGCGVFCVGEVRLLCDMCSAKVIRPPYLA